MAPQRETILKEKVINELREIPNFRAVCEKLRIPTPLLYKWKREDKTFWDSATRNLEIGRDWISNLAEQKLVQQISNGNLSAIKYWNEYNNPHYRKRKPAEQVHDDDQRSMTLADLISKAHEARRKRDARKS